VNSFTSLIEQHLSENYQRKNPQFKDWETPPTFFTKLDAEFHFTLDAAASHENALGNDLCRAYCTELDGTWARLPGDDYDTIISSLDGLHFPWKDHRVFCNPPYDSTVPLWCAKAALREADVAVLLLPPSIDTAWFHDYVWKKADDVRFLRGRLKFFRNGVVGPAPRAGNLIAVYYK
jgi:phage N-6-adenine-methyltransferase